MPVTEDRSLILVFFLEGEQKEEEGEGKSRKFWRLSSAQITSHQNIF